MTANDANGPISDATEPARRHRSHAERRDGGAGDSETTSTGDVAVDLDAAGVDTAPWRLAVRFGVWRAGASPLDIDETGLEYPRNDSIGPLQSTRRPRSNGWGLGTTDT